MYIYVPIVTDTVISNILTYILILYSFTKGISDIQWINIHYKYACVYSGEGRIITVRKLMQQKYK